MNELSFLRVKIKSLAEEAKIIKLEEKRNKKAREELYLHRINVVRTEARATLLAYGFIKNKPYRLIESKGVVPPLILSRVLKMLDKYWNTPLENRKITIETLLKDWLNEPTA